MFPMVRPTAIHCDDIILCHSGPLPQFTSVSIDRWPLFSATASYRIRQHCHVHRSHISIDHIFCKNRTSACQLSSTRDIRWHFSAMSLSLSRAECGKLPDGDTVYEYTLTNANRLTVKLITRGCTITSVLVPSATSAASTAASSTATSTLADVVLGFPDLNSWLQNGNNFNSIVGRYANRIRDGRFTIDGQSYQLATNNGPNHLHGGPSGFYSRNWREVRQVTESDRVGVVLTYTSADGEEGYPGRLVVTATFTLTNSNALSMRFEAEVFDKPTIVNICNHAYWNLSGDYADDVLSHRLYLNAQHNTPVDGTMIPTGVIQPTAGSHHDFSQLTGIGQRIDVFKSVDPACGGGYDHNYVLSKPSTSTVTHPDAEGQVHAATLVHDASGRRMDIYTTAPGIQVYTGNFLTGSMTGKEGRPYQKHAGVCMETQVHPDSPNQPGFPSCVLRPGEKYTHVVTHVFSTADK